MTEEEPTERGERKSSYMATDSDLSNFMKSGVLDEMFFYLINQANKSEEQLKILSLTFLTEIMLNLTLLES